MDGIRFVTQTPGRKTDINQILVEILGYGSWFFSRHALLMITITDLFWTLQFQIVVSTTKLFVDWKKYIVQAHNWFITTKPAFNAPLINILLVAI